MIGTMFSDPVFQFGIFAIVVGTIAVLLVLRSQVGSRPVAVARGTRLVLTLGVLGVLLVSGWSGWHALSAQGQGGTVPASSASSPATSSSPSAGSPATPVQEPSPTPTPHLSRSITQVLTAFCQAISARDYPVAWSLYATSLQHRHAYTAVVEAWRHYTACRIPDQAYDPDAIALLTLTLAPGRRISLALPATRMNGLPWASRRRHGESPQSAILSPRAVIPWCGDNGEKRKEHDDAQSADIASARRAPPPSGGRL